MPVVSALLRVDARNVRRDPLLAVVMASPLILAGALRLGHPVVERWAASVHGLALEPHRGLLLGFLVVLHVPFIFGMLGALLVLDDIDDRSLLPLRVTPVTVEGYLGHRSGVVSGASLLGLAVAVPASGLVAGVGWAVVPALILAAACAPVVMLATLSLASNKVEGLVVIKALGLPVYVPLVTWFVDGPWVNALAVVPTYWPVRALWAALDGRIDVIAVTVGAAYLIALLIGLRARTLRRI